VTDDGNWAVVHNLQTGGQRQLGAAALRWTSAILQRGVVTPPPRKQLPIARMLHSFFFFHPRD